LRPDAAAAALATSRLDWTVSGETAGRSVGRALSNIDSVIGALKPSRRQPAFDDHTSRQLLARPPRDDYMPTD